MARMLDEAHDVAGRDAGAGAEKGQDPDEARFAEHVSGVFAKSIPDAAKHREPGACDQAVLVRKHGRSRVGRLRLIGGAVVVVLAGWGSEIAETLERGEAFAIEVSPVPAAGASASLQPLIEIRALMGERCAFVAGVPVKLTKKELAVLEVVLSAPDGTTYQEFDRVVWPGRSGDLAGSRHMLVYRLNADLEPHVDAALERAGEPRRDGHLVRCENGRVFMTVRSGTCV